MRKTFDAELTELGTQLTEMAATAQDAIDLVTASLSREKRTAQKPPLPSPAAWTRWKRILKINACLC